MPHDQNIKHISNIVTTSVKTLKTVYIQKNLLKKKKKHMPNTHTIASTVLPDIARGKKIKDIVYMHTHT